MKNLKFLFIAFLLIIPFGIFAQTKSNPVVEVIYFHGAQRCKTCMALEKVAKETVNEAFAQQLKEGKVAFRTVDISSQAGEKIADRYKIAQSSLIVVRKDGKKEQYTNLTSDGFRFAVNNPDKLKGIISNQINTFLKR